MMVYNKGLSPLTACCNINCPYESHFQPKSREISLTHNINFSCPTLLKFCTEHGSVTAVLCVNRRNCENNLRITEISRDLNQIGVLQGYNLLPRFSVLSSHLHYDMRYGLRSVPLTLPRARHQNSNFTSQQLLSTYFPIIIIFDIWSC